MTTTAQSPRSTVGTYRSSNAATDHIIDLLARDIDDAILVLTGEKTWDVTVPVVGYFTTDAAYCDFLEAFDVAFAAVAYGKPMGFGDLLTPVVTRNVLEGFVAYQQYLGATGVTVDEMTWDGNGVMVVPSDAEVIEVGEGVYARSQADAIWLVPDAEGLFDLSPLGYAFYAVAPEGDDEDRVVRRVQ